MGGTGRTEGSFYRACKVLKDDLVRMAFLERKTGGIAARMEVWEKWKVVNQLLIVGKKRAAVTLGTELVGQAQKVGNMEVLVGVSSFLEVHFGGLDIDTRRWLRYRKIRKDAAQMYEDELWVKALQARVVMGIERGRDMVELEGEIADLSIKNEGSVTYLRFRLSALAAWYERKGKTAALLTVLRETMMAYEVTGQVLPEGAMFNLQFRMTPILTRLGRYAEAELNLAKALEKKLFWGRKTGTYSCSKKPVSASIQANQQWPSLH